MESAKRVFHICDAPGHGNDINGGSADHYPEGSPEGLKVDSLMKEFDERGIDF